MTDVWRAIWSRDGEVLCSLKILSQDEALDALNGREDEDDDGPIPVDYLVCVETLRCTARDLHATIARLTRERDELSEVATGLRMNLGDAQGAIVRLERELAESRASNTHLTEAIVDGSHERDQLAKERDEALAALRDRDADLKAASRLSTLIVVRVCNALAPADVKVGDEVEDAVRRVRVQRDRLRAIVVKEGLCCEGMALGKQTHSPDCLEAQDLGEEPK